MKKLLRQHVLILGVVALLLVVVAVEAFLLPSSSSHRCCAITTPRLLFAVKIEEEEKKTPKSVADSSFIRKAEEISGTTTTKDSSSISGEQQQQILTPKQAENEKEEVVAIDDSAMKEVQNDRTVAAVDDSTITTLENTTSTIGAKTTIFTSSNSAQTMLSTNNKTGEEVTIINSVVVNSNNSTMSDEKEVIISKEKKEKNVENIEGSSLSNKAAEGGKDNGNVVEKKGESSTMEEKSPPVVYTGIGGKGGFSYDVNKLKQNLVQQAVADCKEQLWDLLEAPLTNSRRRRSSSSRTNLNKEQQDMIEEKFAALCQANPVYTTTDSYLLEGQWTFVFSSKKPARVLMDPDRFENEYKTEIPGDVVGETRSGSRQFVLESLEADQDPYVLDKKRYYYGIFERERVYDVMSLTRTSLDLDLSQRTWKLVGRFPLWRTRYNKMTPTEIMGTNLKILYVDSDLCISTEENMDNPFTIYTRSDAWNIRTQKLNGRWKSLRSRVTACLHPFRKRSHNENNNDVDTKKGLPQSSNTSTLIGLGDFDDTKNNAAWEGEMDPFVNVPSGERQEILKSLQVGEIEEMGEKQQEMTEKMHQEKQFEFVREKKGITKKRGRRQNKKGSKANTKDIPRFLQTEEASKPSSEYSIKLQREKPFNQPE